MLGGLLAVAALAIGLAMSRAEARQNVAEIEKVRDNLYVIKGGGGNTAAFITEKGVVVVDTKLVGWGQGILDKIRGVTDKPVTMIINTHTHGDHVGSNAEFPPTVEVVAHENTKANMEKMAPFQTEAGKGFLPKRTYKDKMTLLGGSDRIDLYYFGRGHTNGDTIIVFPLARVMHTGDLFAGRGTPLIDTNNGGSGVEYPKTVARAVAGITGVDAVIPGHSGVTTWQAFAEFADFNQAFLTAVEAAMKEGKSADAATAALKLPERFKDYGLQRVKDNVTKIYAELKQ
jgi:glyoxylase-like metal-dependent hydrolase (beta-lactamase superfamily II)